MTASTGRYRIIDRLGAGGMGVVYRAEDVVLRRPVAIKFLAAGMAADEEYRARFLREARVAAALNHPNTCVVYEVGEVDASDEIARGIAAAGTPFIAMEFVDGETLAGRLSREQRLAVPDAVDVAIQLAEGLAEAHRANIVHRDLKPHNVMVAASGRVKIVDFGLAKPPRPVREGHDLVTTSDMISADVGALTVVGTCTYMSPEQAVGKPLDARSDVFSFGIVLYEMLTGGLPFRGDTATEVLAKIIETDPEPLPPGVSIPKALERTMWRCLRKKPSERYDDASGLLKDLQNVKPTLLDRGGRQAARGLRRLAAVGGVSRSARRLWMGALFLAVAVAVFTLPGTPDSEPNDTPADRALEPIAPPVAPGPIDASASDEEVVTDAAERPLLIGPTNTQVSAPEAGVVPVPLRSPAPPSPPEEAPVPGDPEPFGGLSIASSPRASVSLDGELKGITPLDLKVAPGAHEVILTGPENLRWRGRLDIAQGQTLSLERDLTATGRLSVVTNVWAEASLDDGPTEQTPIQFPRVASGLHRLRVFRDGYVTQVREIVIESGETTRVSLTLDKQP